MRLEKFESFNKEPIGEGIQKKVFVNPNDEGRVISEMKEDTRFSDKETTRQLKGRYYLTKIVHILLPKNIPDIYQTRESSEGIQTVDAERISHTEGHALYQKIRSSGGRGENVELAREQIKEEMGVKLGDLNSKLYSIGFFDNIDSNIANFTKDKNGNVYYLETFLPWKTAYRNPKELVLLFNEEELRNAINNVPNQKEKERCSQYLNRLLVLFDEEKKKLQKKLG